MSDLKQRIRDAVWAAFAERHERHIHGDRHWGDALDAALATIGIDALERERDDAKAEADHYLKLADKLNAELKKARQIAAPPPAPRPRFLRLTSTTGDGHSVPHFFRADAIDRLIESGPSDHPEHRSAALEGGKWRGFDQSPAAILAALGAEVVDVVEPVAQPASTNMVDAFGVAVWIEKLREVIDDLPGEFTQKDCLDRMVSRKAVHKAIDSMPPLMAQPAQAAKGEA